MLRLLKVNSSNPFFVLLVICLVGPTHANAAIVYSNLGPGDTFSGYGDSFGKGSREYIFWGASFTLGSSSFAFTSAEVPLVSLSGSNEVTFGLRSDNSGLPGALLQSFSASIPPNGYAIVTFHGTVPFVLNCGTTYWLTSEDDAPDDTYAGWFENNIGFVKSVAIRYGSGDWLTSFYPPDIATVAFRINGDLIAVTDCPEPTSIAMLGVGALCFLGNGLRRRNLRKRPAKAF
jgi:hypothetical protein